jgi:hypothetical protein
LVSARSIHAAVNLYSNLPSERGGSFEIIAKNTGDVLFTDVQSVPIDSSLNMVASAYFANVEVRLPPAYEGKLALWNANNAIDLLCDNSTVLDPAGEGRRRDLQYVVDSGLLYGSIAWVPQHYEPGAGSAYVETTMGTTKLVCSESKPQADRLARFTGPG